MLFLLNFVHFEAIFAYSETIFANFETKIPDRCGRGSSLYRPIHDVAPRAVSLNMFSEISPCAPLSRDDNLTWGLSSRA